MQIGNVTAVGGRPPGKGDDNDLPREGRNPDPELDRAAKTGDARNDENTMISQLHVVFLHAHNALVNAGRTFGAARRVLCQHYRHIVLHDFLKRIVDPATSLDLHLLTFSEGYSPDRVLSPIHHPASRW